MLSWGIILIACFYGQQITGFYTVPYLVPVLFLLCGCIRLQSLKKKWLYYAEIALLGGILFDVMYAINCFEITIFRDSCTVIAIVFIVMQCVKTLQNKAAWIGSLLYLLSFIGYWLISPENRFFISFMIINSIFTLYCALAIVNRFVKKQNESIENEVTMIHPIRKNIYMKIGALLLAGCCITFIVSLGKTMNHLSVMEHETNWQLYKGKETGIIELESMQFHSENTIDSHTNTVGMTFVCEEDKAPLIRAIALQSKDGNMNMIYQNEEVVFQKRNDGKYAYSIAFTFEHDIDEVILPSKIEVYAYQENNIKQDKEQQFTDAWVKEMITLQSLEAQHYQAELSDKNIKPVSYTHLKQL